MPREKSPAFRWYAERWLHDDFVRGLDRETRDLYFELINESWINQGLPPDPNAICALIREHKRFFCPRWEKLKCKFWLDPATNRFVNPPLEIEREKQRQYSESQAKKAKQKHSVSAAAEPGEAEAPADAAAMPARAMPRAHAVSVSVSVSEKEKDLSLAQTEKPVSPESQTSKPLSLIPEEEPQTGFDFEAVYALYPRKGPGRKKGLERCEKHITTQEQYANLLAAVRNYAADCKSKGTEQGFIKHFSSFISVWEDWIPSGQSSPENEPQSDWEKAHMARVLKSQENYRSRFFFDEETA